MSKGKFEAPRGKARNAAPEEAAVRKRTGAFEAGRGRGVNKPTAAPAGIVKLPAPATKAPAVPVATAPKAPSAAVPKAPVTTTAAPVTGTTAPAAAPRTTVTQPKATVTVVKPLAVPPKPPLRGIPEPEPAPEQNNKPKRRWPLIAGLALLAVLALGLGIFLTRDRLPEAGPQAMTQEELLAHYRSLATTLLEQDLVLTLHAAEAPDREELDLTVTVPPSHSGAWVDLTKLEMDLADGVGKVRGNLYEADPENYISLDLAALEQIARETVERYGKEYVPSSVWSETHLEPAPTEATEENASEEATEPSEEATKEPSEDGEDETAETVPAPQQVEIEYLILDRGSIQRSLDAQSIYDTLVASLYAGQMEPELSYSYREPDPLDLDAIWAEYCTPPVDAELNPETFAITPEIPGYGFNRKNAAKQIELAEEGSLIRLRMGPIQPAATVATVEAALYAEVLGEANTPHTWQPDRTRNLELACEAIDGTVLMPGDIFSFNETVGERTRAKGYKEAIAYVGNESVPEVGGGVCQVASSIYYAVLQADLLTLERHEHTFLVTYVPQGMDAAIYWGLLDYKFQNSSPYPIKIDASVSGGQVHITLRGTEWRDYTVKLSYNVVSTIPWETVTRYVYDGSYYDGEVITTPYTGARVITYKTTYDLMGNEIETQQIAVSNYRKRDKVIAVAATLPTPDPEPEPEPTE